MITAGNKAPDFKLKDKAGIEVSLSDYLGKKTIVYFYPRDNTPGCTRQACAFALNYNKFREIGVEVIGISADSEASHEKFAREHNLPFILLSDPELTAIKAYDVWKDKTRFGVTAPGIVRTTFIIDERGYVQKVFEDVNPDTNAEDILKYLELIRKDDENAE